MYKGLRVYMNELEEREIVLMLLVILRVMAWFLSFSQWGNEVCGTVFIYRELKSLLSRLQKSYHTI